MQSDRNYKLVGYALKSYSEPEKNYMTYNKKMLGIMRGLGEWRNLLI
jgi:hypothetical protein